MADSENDAILTEESEDKLNCTVELSDSGPWQKKISIVIPRDEIDAAMSEQYGDLTKTAEIPGFRKGRAPRVLVQKRFGDEVTEQTKLRLLARAFEQVEDDQDFEILGEPDFDPGDIVLPDEGDMTFEYEVEVKPEFDLPELEGIKVEKPIFEVTDDKLDDAIEEICKRYGTLKDLEEKDKAVAEDVVRSDVTIKVDGIEEEETLIDHPLRVYEGGIKGVWVEDLEKVLKGAKVGDTKTCSAEAPDTHNNEEWQGKKVDFSISIKAIRRMIPAEMNDDLFNKLGVGDEEELRKYLSEDMERRADNEVRQEMSRQVMDFLSEKIDIELPKKILARHEARALQRRYYELMQNGVAQDQIAENIEKLRSASSEQAMAELKMSFIMEKVAEQLEIAVTDAEVNGWVAQIAMMNRRRPEKVRDELRSQGRLEDLQDQIRNEKAIDKLLEMAEVVDKPLEADKAPKETAKKKKTTKKTTKKAAKKAEDKGEDSDKDESTAKKARKKVKRKPPSKKDADD